MPKRTRNKGGRPPFPAGKRRDIRVALLFSPAEREALNNWAGERTMAEAIRGLLRGPGGPFAPIP